MYQLDNRIALITGGGSGIGRAAALLFAQEGAIVIVCNRRIKNGEETVRLIREQGGMLNLYKLIFQNTARSKR